MVPVRSRIRTAAASRTRTMRTERFTRPAYQRCARAGRRRVATRAGRRGGHRARLRWSGVRRDVRATEAGWSSGAAGSARRATSAWPTSRARSRSIPALADDDLRRLDRPRPRPGRGRPADRRRGRGDGRRPRGPAGRGRRRHDRLGPGPRGRPPQPRGGPGRADRATGRPPAHRPLAQRPGRDRPAPLVAPRGRPSSMRRSWRWSAPWSAWPSATARRSCPAPPTSSRPSRSSSGTTCWPTSRCSSAIAAGWPTPGRRLNVSPLGSGALAGAGYPLDRAAIAAELGFDGPTANSLDAVSDRDFVVELLAAIALGMVHLSRLAEELTWWSNPRFGFVRLAGRLLDRQLDDAQQEEPRPGRAGPGPGRSARSGR